MIDKTNRVLEEVQKVIIGKEEVIKKVFTAILADGHILLEDIPGVGKTTLALAFTKVLGIEFNRIQFTPDTVASDITGFTLYNKEKGEFQFQEGAVMCHLLLADELNRTTSRTQAALLEVMEEKNVTVDGNTYPLPKPFHVIATQNPLDSYGTQALPISQLDRFMIKMSMGYPNFQSQVALLKDRQTGQPLEAVEAVVHKDDLLAMQERVAQLYIADDILVYITHLTEVTRNHPLIRQGISPRGALALTNMAKANAFLEGRDYVIPEDVMAHFVDTCSHRILIDPQAQLSDQSAAMILQDILEKEKTPDLALD